MPIALIVLSSALAVALLLALHTWLWARVLRVRAVCDEQHQVRTEDGWHLALLRYRGEPTPDRPPVVLSHGVAANHRNLDLDEQHSLARSLHRMGRDVWLLDLRGAGRSARARGRAGRRGRWSFDDHLCSDLPAALAEVRRVTGVSEVDWVGFSMGGLLGYAYFGGEPQPRDPRPRLRRMAARATRWTTGTWTCYLGELPRRRSWALSWNGWRVAREEQSGCLCVRTASSRRALRATSSGSPVDRAGRGAPPSSFGPSPGSLPRSAVPEGSPCRPPEGG